MRSYADIVKEAAEKQARKNKDILKANKDDKRAKKAVYPTKSPKMTQQQRWRLEREQEAAAREAKIDAKKQAVAAAKEDARLARLAVDRDALAPRRGAENVLMKGSSDAEKLLMMKKRGGLGQENTFPVGVSFPQMPESPWLHPFEENPVIDREVWHIYSLKIAAGFIKDGERMNQAQKPIKSMSTAELHALRMRCRTSSGQTKTSELYRMLLPSERAVVYREAEYIHDAALLEEAEKATETKIRDLEKSHKNFADLKKAPRHELNAEDRDLLEGIEECIEELQRQIDDEIPKEAHALTMEYAQWAKVNGTKMRLLTKWDRAEGKPFLPAGSNDELPHSRAYEALLRGDTNNQLPRNKEKGLKESRKGRNVPKASKQAALKNNSKRSSLRVNAAVRDLVEKPLPFEGEPQSLTLPAWDSGDEEGGHRAETSNASEVQLQQPVKKVHPDFGDPDIDEGEDDINAALEAISNSRGRWSSSKRNASEAELDDEDSAPPKPDSKKAKLASKGKDGDEAKRQLRSDAPSPPSQSARRKKAPVATSRRQSKAASRLVEQATAQEVKENFEQVQKSLKKAAKVTKDSAECSTAEKVSPVSPVQAESIETAENTQVETADTLLLAFSDQSTTPSVTILISQRQWLRGLNTTPTMRISQTDLLLGAARSAQIGRRSTDRFHS